MKKTGDFQINTEWLCPYKTCKHENKEYDMDLSYSEVTCEKCGRKVMLEDN